MRGSQQCEIFEGPPYRQCQRKAVTKRKRSWGRFQRMCRRHAERFDSDRGSGQ
jgi:hypothetical protein